MRTNRCISKRGRELKLPIGEGKEGVKWEGGRGMEKGPLSLWKGLLFHKSHKADTSKGERRDGACLGVFWKDVIMKGAPESN